MPRSSNGAAPVAPAGAAPETRLSQEARLLRDAQNAVRMGDTAMANRLLDEHARAFPHGVLEEEREAERTLLQCASGTDAVVAGERFLRRFPDSLLVARVRSACLP